MSGMSQIQLPLLLSQPGVHGGGQSWSTVRDLGLRQASLASLQCQQFGSTLPKTLLRSHIPSLKSREIWLHSWFKLGFFIPPSHERATVFPAGASCHLSSRSRLLWDRSSPCGTSLMGQTKPQTRDVLFPVGINPATQTPLQKPSKEKAQPPPAPWAGGWLPPTVGYLGGSGGCSVRCHTPPPTASPLLTAPSFSPAPGIATICTTGAGPHFI